MKNPSQLKFRYCEKVTKFFKNSQFLKRFKAVLLVRKHFGLTKYNNIGTFEPKGPFVNCWVKCFLTDRTALKRLLSNMVDSFKSL